MPWCVVRIWWYGALLDFGSISLHSKVTLSRLWGLISYLKAFCCACLYTILAITCVCGINTAWFRIKVIYVYSTLRYPCIGFASQPRHSSDIWESVVSQPWPKTRYQFILSHGTTKLILNYESLSSQTASQLSKFKEQSHRKHWVTRPYSLATHSNHCDVTVRLVSLKYIDTLFKKDARNI